MNRLNKTKVEKEVDHEAERQERLRVEGRKKKAEAIDRVGFGLGESLTPLGQDSGGTKGSVGTAEGRPHVRGHVHRRGHRGRQGRLERRRFYVERRGMDAACLGQLVGSVGFS